uniref:thioredoxin family protein n=1 Tax=Prevotella sp. TaxID=59823 RepID=UPI004029E373
ITRSTVLQAPKKRVVFEDVTGLWCQYCPRGIAIMEYMERIHPDDFIGISIHDDAMRTNAYTELMSKWTGRPYITFNRYEKVNSYTGEGEYNMAMNQTANFDINVKANFDESGNNIIVSTDVLPCLPTAENDKYEVAYVLTADGLKNDSWVQNVAAGEWDGIEGLPEEYAPFLGGVSEVRGLTFNQVAIASKGVEYGVEGSLTAPYTVGEMQNPTVTFENISQHNLIQDRSKLNVCALIICSTIDPNTKAVTKTVIDNAAKCRVGNDNSGTGIKELTDSADSAITGYYSLDGRRLNAPAKGVTIVRYANGKTIKIQK